MYVNSNDVVFGANLSGRTGGIAGVDRIVSPTATSVPIRIVLEPLEYSADFLQGVQDQALEMNLLEHRGLANIGRVCSSAKIACDFQNLLVIQPNTKADMDRNLMHSRAYESVHLRVFDTYPLTMEILLDNESLTVKAIYDPGLIDRRQMDRISFQFRHILHQLCICGDETLMQEIRTISPEDVDTLWRWNAKLPNSSDSCIHSLIEENMLEKHDAQAIYSWDGNLSYRELDIQSSRIAHHLIGMGVGPEVPVPILFKKSKWFVIAILGALKAGGAFAPLDPSHPPARLASIVDQLNADILLCSQVYSNKCQTTFPGRNIFVLDNLGFAELTEIDTPPHAKITSDNAAYVVFTSGTTGVPEGIVVEHGQYCSSAKVTLQGAPLRSQFKAFAIRIPQL